MKKMMSVKSVVFSLFLIVCFSTYSLSIPYGYEEKLTEKPSYNPVYETKLHSQEEPSRTEDKVTEKPCGLVCKLDKAKGKVVNATKSAFDNTKEAFRNAGKKVKEVYQKKVEEHKARHQKCKEEKEGKVPTVVKESEVIYEKEAAIKETEIVYEGDDKVSLIESPAEGGVEFDGTSQIFEERGESTIGYGLNNDRRSETSEQPIGYGGQSDFNSNANGGNVGLDGGQQSIFSNQGSNFNYGDGLSNFDQSTISPVGNVGSQSANNFNIDGTYNGGGSLFDVSSSVPVSEGASDIFGSQTSAGSASSSSRSGSPDFEKAKKAIDDLVTNEKKSSSGYY